jgi:hypothetical protein
MNTITLQPITITFTQTSKFSVEDYLEWCEMTENIPSQKGYKRYVIDQFEDDLRDDINTNNMSFKYGKEKEYEYEEVEDKEDEDDIPFDYNDYVSDLSEEELKQFHRLVELDKFIINPMLTIDNIVIMNTIEDSSILNYGVKIDKETGEIICIKKSTRIYFLYEYLKDTP